MPPTIRTGYKSRLQIVGTVYRMQQRNFMIPQKTNVNWPIMMPIKQGRRHRSMNNKKIENHAKSSIHTEKQKVQYTTIIKIKTEVALEICTGAMSDQSIYCIIDKVEDQLKKGKIINKNA